MAGRRVGDGEPCFVIAEAGVNHNGSINVARELIDVAAGAGGASLRQRLVAVHVADCSPGAPIQGVWK